MKHKLTDRELQALVSIVSVDNGLRGKPTFQEYKATMKNEPEPEPNTLDWLIAVTVGGWTLIGFVIWITGKVAGWW